jgi:hypothetical protein
MAHSDLQNSLEWDFHQALDAFVLEFLIYMIIRQSIQQASRFESS